MERQAKGKHQLQMEMPILTPKNTIRPLTWRILCPVGDAKIEELVEAEKVSGNKLEQHMSIPNLFCICKCTLYSHCITLAICLRILVFIELKVSETRSICPGDFAEQTSNKYLLSLRMLVKRFITSASYLL